MEVWWSKTNADWGETVSFLSQTEQNRHHVSLGGNINLTAAAGDYWTRLHAGCSSPSHRTVHTHFCTSTDHTVHCSYAVGAPLHSHDLQTERRKEKAAKLQPSEWFLSDWVAAGWNHISPTALFLVWFVSEQSCELSQSEPNTELLLWWNHLEPHCSFRLLSLPVQETINQLCTASYHEHRAVKYTCRGLVRSVVSDWDHWQSELTFFLDYFPNKLFNPLGAKKVLVRSSQSAKLDLQTTQELLTLSLLRQKR